MIISILSPNNGFIPYETVKCLLDLKGYEFYLVQGADLAYNRNKAFNYAIGAKDHLLFIDSDMTFTVGDIIDMERRMNEGLDVVCAAYAMGTPPYPQCIFDRFDDDYELTEPLGGLQQIGAGGTGFMAINKNIMSKLPKDPFDYIREGDILHGDDISFCHRVNENGFKVWCDNDIKVGHLRMKPIFVV